MFTPDFLYASPHNHPTVTHTSEERSATVFKLLNVFEVLSLGMKRKTGCFFLFSTLPAAFQYFNVNNIARRLKPRATVGACVSSRCMIRNFIVFHQYFFLPLVVMPSIAFICEVMIVIPAAEQKA